MPNKTSASQTSEQAAALGRLAKSADIAQQHSRPMILRDQQIDRAVIVIIPGDNRARILKLNFVESNVGRNILPPVWPQIAKQPNLAAPILSLANRSEINPAVVVIIKGDDSIRRETQSTFGSGTCSKPLPRLFRHRVGCWTLSILRNRQIHPPVVIEIEDRHPLGMRRDYERPRTLQKSTLSGINKKNR